MTAPKRGQSRRSQSAPKIRDAEAADIEALTELDADVDAILAKRRALRAGRTLDGGGIKASEVSP